MKKVATIVAAIALFGACTFSMTSCATDQGHGSHGHWDSQTAVEPAWKRALERTRR